MSRLGTSVLGLVGAFSLVAALTHCASASPPAGPNALDAGPSPDALTPPTPTSTATTPPGPTSVDPWTAPAGDLVPNALVEDGWYDLRFLPSPANVEGGWHDSVAVQSDGRSFLFAYSAWEFADLTDLGMFNVTGPLRAGMTGPELKNFRADLTASGWSISYLSTNSAERVNEAAPSTNVAQDLQVFVRYTGSKGDIYFATKSAGAWGTPRLMPGPANGAACSNDNPFVVGNMSTGVDLYFESDRTDVTCTAGGAQEAHLPDALRPKDRLVHARKSRARHQRSGSGR